MGLVYFDIEGNKIGKTQTGLNISINGMSMTISAGNINGISVPDTVINFVSPANDRQIEILLLRKTLNNSGEIWIDNRIKGRNRANTPIGYNIVETLCWFILPAKTTNLADININVRRIL